MDETYSVGVVGGVVVVVVEPISGEYDLQAGGGSEEEQPRTGAEPQGGNVEVEKNVVPLFATDACDGWETDAGLQLQFDTPEPVLDAAGAASLALALAAWAASRGVLISSAPASERDTLVIENATGEDLEYRVLPTESGV